MNLFKNVHASWIPLLHSLAHKEPLVKFLDTLKDINFQPSYEEIFKVFEMPVKDIKVVILGQDPYPIPGAATGLSYAIKEDSKPSFILGIVKKEIQESGVKTFDMENDSYNTLEHLREQGVFLLNTALTVETGSAGSHVKYWKEFTQSVISFISSENPCIWLLWGEGMKRYQTYIKKPVTKVETSYTRETIEEIPIYFKENYIIEGDHPAAISLGLKKFSNDSFYTTNVLLRKTSNKEIIW